MTTKKQQAKAAADAEGITIELHLSTNPAFTRGPWGRRVKKAGGTYRAARGTGSTRFVHVPAKSMDLICDLVERFGNRGARGGCVFVVRGPGMCGIQSHQVVGKIAMALDARAIILAKIASATKARDEYQAERAAVVAKEDARREAEREERAAPWKGIRLAVVMAGRRGKPGALADLDRELDKMGILDLVKVAPFRT